MRNPLFAKVWGTNGYGELKEKDGKGGLPAPLFLRVCSRKNSRDPAYYVGKVFIRDEGSTLAKLRLALCLALRRLAGQE